MSDEIIKVLDELGKKFGVAIDWTQQNVMPYVQDLGSRIIKYEIATSIVWIVASLLVIASFGFLAYLSNKKSWIIDIKIGFIALLICSIVLGGMIITDQIIDIIKCCTIPEAVWLQYIQNYIGQ